MIDLIHDELLSLAEAAKRLPILRGGKRPHTSTIYRWIQRGVRGVRLEAARVGGTVCTSVEALQRFVDALSSEVRPDRTSPSSRAQAASRELEEDGL